MPRRSSAGLTLISWRDIPAQINAGSGDDKQQHMFPRRFQKAIDRAAMVADKKSANEYVGEWRRSTIPLTPEAAEAGTEGVLAAITAEIERIEAAFPMEELDRYVQAGGWNPDRPEEERI